jgi:hypothetical protein
MSHLGLVFRIGDFSPIRASDLSKEILTNPKLGLTVTGFPAPDWTAT